MALMEQRKPVIITQSPLVAKVAGKWRLDYLRANPSDVPCTVYAHTPATSAIGTTRRTRHGLCLSRVHAYAEADDEH